MLTAFCLLSYSISMGDNTAPWRKTLVSTRGLCRTAIKQSSGGLRLLGHIQGRLFPVNVTPFLQKVSRNSPSMTVLRAYPMFRGGRDDLGAVVHLVLRRRRPARIPCARRFPHQIHNNSGRGWTRVRMASCDGAQLRRRSEAGSARRSTAGRL